MNHFDRKYILQVLKREYEETQKGLEKFSKYFVDQYEKKVFEETVKGGKILNDVNMLYYMNKTEKNALENWKLWFVYALGRYQGKADIISTIIKHLEKGEDITFSFIQGLFGNVT